MQDDNLLIKMSHRSEILQMYLVILYARNCPTAFQQLTAFQSHQLTVMPPGDLSVLENVQTFQSKAKL